MSASTRVVDAYMEAFGRTDRPAILACLTDDVEWLIPGVFHMRGKAEFDSQIENDAFVGPPAITVSRHMEQGDVVVTEGSVRAQRRDGGTMDMVFCDVFELRDGRIAKLTSYLMEIRP